ncbi:MAG TPA: GMC family oxidoreductase [Methylophilaceae bacterium]|nr:GMC family oxidoreductase [Methylophilaceae bacterium]
MLIDLNLASITANVKQYDVCIAGAGPSGITIARILAAQGKRVALLEGGGLEYSQQSQDLYEGKSIGLNYFDAVKSCRLRYLGGASNHWGGMCSFFEEADFKREMNGMPGWPISRDEVFKYFDAAKAVLDLPKDAFAHKKELGFTNFTQFMFSLSPPTRFNSKYQKELKESKQIDLYINASLTNVLLDNSLDHVNHLEITNGNLAKFKFSATQYVLAMGAIENARMLLAANSQIKTGIGNAGGMVGRCFMEHFNIGYGRFAIDNPTPWKGGIAIRSTTAFSSKANVGSGHLLFSPNETIIDYGRTAALKHKLRQLVCKSETATELTRKMMEFDCDGDGLITSIIEQSPNPNSRITLDTERDRFGIPRIILNWQYTQYDLNTIRTLGIEAAKEIAKLGYARVHLHEDILDKSMEVKNIGAHCHQMGTTRMSSTPKYGVVDENSRVHGMKNLFVAGSSVYATGGPCNPTFTLTMLAHRLGDHLLTVTA